MVVEEHLILDLVLVPPDPPVLMALPVLLVLPETPVVMVVAVVDIHTRPVTLRAIPRPGNRNQTLAYSLNSRLKGSIVHGFVVRS